MALHPILDNKFTYAQSRHKMGGNAYEFYKENCGLALSMPAAMAINSYKDIHSYPSPYTFDSLYRGLQNDYPSNAVVNLIVISMFPEICLFRFYMETRTNLLVVLHILNFLRGFGTRKFIIQLLCTFIETVEIKRSYNNCAESTLHFTTFY